MKNITLQQAAELHALRKRNARAEREIKRLKAEMVSRATSLSKRCASVEGGEKIAKKLDVLAKIESL